MAGFRAVSLRVLWRELGVVLHGGSNVEQRDSFAPYDGREAEPVGRKR